MGLDGESGIFFCIIFLDKISMVEFEEMVSPECMK